MELGHRQERLRDHHLEAGAGFDELDAGLDRSGVSPPQRARDLRRLAALAATEPLSDAQRKRFSERWLGMPPPTEPEDRETERRVYQWCAWGAHVGDHAWQQLLGHCYREGRGVGENLRRACGWYQAAAAGGCREADFWARKTGLPGGARGPAV